MSDRRLCTGMVTLLLPLAGCVSMSGLGGDSKYACAAPEGVACDSVSGTYANAVQESLPSQRRQEHAPAPTTGHAPSPAGAANASGKAAPPLHAPLDAAAPTHTASPGPRVLRSQARYLRLWVKPWEDIDGDLFDQAHVYVQIDHGRWQMDHVRQQIRERYAPLRPPVSSAPSHRSEPAGGSDAADATDAGKQIARPTATDSRSLFPSLTSPPAGQGARPQ